MNREGQVWIRIFPDKPITRKPADVRMGKGKGDPAGWVAPVTPGRILVTEKMTKITDKSSVEKTYKAKGEERTKKAEAKYGFIVRPEANKLEIKNEVESMYNVTVIDVNTCRYAGKRSSRYTKAGLIKGQKNAFKKAIVTLKEGDTIDFYSNIQ